MLVFYLIVLRLLHIVASVCWAGHSRGWGKGTTRISQVKSGLQDNHGDGSMQAGFLPLPGEYIFFDQHVVTQAQNFDE